MESRRASLYAGDERQAMAHDEAKDTAGSTGPKTKTIGITGHRPPRLGGYTLEVERRLATLAEQMLRELTPGRVVTGMAQGWDLAVAEACIREAVPFVAALAFPGTESGWPQEQQTRFARVLAQAEHVHTHADAPGKGAYHARDRWIVERSDLVVALWDGEPSGGAFSTIRSAQKRGVPVHDMWPGWLALAER